MNFDLNDEQIQLQDSALRLGREHYGFNAWRVRAAAGRGVERTDWLRMAELGWLGLNVPEPCGGLGGTAVDTMVVMEAFGRFLMLEPFVSTCIIAPALLRHAAPAHRASLMTQICEGAVFIAFADAEPASRFDLGWVSTRAKASADGFVLTGEKTHAMDGAAADWFLIPARTSGADGDALGISLFLVSANVPGLTVEPARAMDNRQNARLRLDSVRLDRNALVGKEGEALPLMSEAVDRGVAARLAEALGAMDAVNEMTLDYLKTRQQFGQPIGAFQALQHRAVDMAIACEEARSMTYLATLSLDQAPDARGRIVSAAKARVSQTSLYVGRQAVQLHGGVGFSDELMVGHYLKRLIMIDMAFGNGDHHRRRFAQLSQASAQAGGSDRS